MKYTPGNLLHPADQAAVLRAYVHRYTGDHKPAWARHNRPDGTPYRVQFKDDNDWLANTRFATRKDGRLDLRANYCKSTPTLPLA